MNTFKKGGAAFVNKKREFKKTGRMNEIADEEMDLGLKKQSTRGTKKLHERPLVDASSDSIVDPPFLEVYESEFDFYRRERRKI
jgi:hypothetical protein